MIIIQNQNINMIPQAMATVSAEGLNLQPEEAQVYPPANNYASIRDALLRLGIKATYRAIQSDNFVQDTSGWKLSAEGVGYFAEGNIGGWNINATTIYSDGNEIILDSANKKIESGNYVSGYAGAGFHLSQDLLEVGNIACRGLIRTSVFQKDVISTVGGNLMVLDGDVLDADMDATDAETLTTKATTTFSVGDFLRIKDGTDDEWFEVTAVNGAVYTVERDKNSDYAADTNPAWKKGATVVNYGQSGDGGIFMTASESNAPYLSVFTHAGSPWLTSGAGCLTTRLRIGNLNGYLGYSTDKYGIGIGDTDNYLKFDPTDKLQIKVSGANALHIEYGSDILLTHGGDIKFTSVTAPTACTGALIETAGNIDAGTHKYIVTYINAVGETDLGSISNTVTNDGTHEQNALTSIPTSSSNSVTSRKIYRTKAGGIYYYLLTTIADNTTTTYTDNTADASLTGVGPDGIGIASRPNTASGSIYWGGNIGISLSGDTCFGVGAGNSSIQISNTFIGYHSGYSNVDGYLNTFLGYRAGYTNRSGSKNTFIGYQAGENTLDGWYNTAIGYIALKKNISGQYNVAVGESSLYKNTGSYNVAIGYNSLYDNTSGEYNTAIGMGAGYKCITGARNIFLGYKAGYYETGSDKFFIDNQTRVNELTSRTRSLIYGVFNANPTSQILQLNAAVICGTNSALATSATDGFLYIPSCAGAPTGTPTAYSGKVAMVFDTTNNKLYCYDSGWVDVT